MNEFGAEFDGARGVSGCDREDAAAYPIAGFQDFDVYAGLMQRTSRSQSGGTSTDDYDHGIDDGRSTN